VLFCLLIQINYVTVGKDEYLLEVPESLSGSVPHDYELCSSKKVKVVTKFHILKEKGSLYSNQVSYSKEIGISLSSQQVDIMVLVEYLCLALHDCALAVRTIYSLLVIAVC